MPVALLIFHPPDAPWPSSVNKRRLAIRASALEWHASGGPWTPEFQKMFDKAGLSLQDDLNKVLVAGHQGPHPQGYHEAVYQRLKNLEGLPGEAYRTAFREELEKIPREIQTPGSYLNKLVTKQ